MSFFTFLSLGGLIPDYYKDTIYFPYSKLWFHFFTFLSLGGLIPDYYKDTILFSKNKKQMHFLCQSLVARITNKWRKCFVDTPYYKNRFYGLTMMGPIVSCLGIR